MFAHYECFCQFIQNYFSRLINANTIRGIGWGIGRQLKKILFDEMLKNWYENQLQLF